MTGRQYLELPDLQRTLQVDQYLSTQGADYEMAIDAASRWIDARCSDPCSNVIRHFWQEDDPTTRLYHADSPQLVKTGDFDSADGVLVEVDQVGDGTWTTLSAGLWQPEPLVRINGTPYTQITATTYGVTFPQSLRPRVRVTARWGWSAVPTPVKQACQILAITFMLGKDVISNEDGYSVRSPGPSNPFAIAESLITDYMPDRPVDMFARQMTGPGAR